MISPTSFEFVVLKKFRSLRSQCFDIIRVVFQTFTARQSYHLLCRQPPTSLFQLLSLWFDSNRILYVGLRLPRGPSIVNKSLHLRYLAPTSFDFVVPIKKSLSALAVCRHHESLHLRYRADLAPTSFDFVVPKQIRTLRSQCVHIINRSTCDKELIWPPPLLTSSCP